MIHVLDGSLPDSDSAKTWRLLETVWDRPAPESSELVSDHCSLIRVATLRATADMINEVRAELQRRENEPGPPIFLFIFDLARFRDLRKADDDFSYGSSRDSVSNPAQLFTEILRDGPGVGIFTFVWVESYQSVQRWLSRDQMNRFEQRVLFAMNVNDSSSLVDSPLAGRLGENRALLYRGDTGTLEKFRPFSPPPGDWLKSLATSTTVPAVSPRIPNRTASVAPTVTLEPISLEHPAESKDPPEAELSDDLPSIDDLHVV